MMEEELYRYKTLYEIECEENEALRKQYRELEIAFENRINELKNSNNSDHNIIYRGLRKVYRKITKR